MTCGIRALKPGCVVYGIGGNNQWGFEEDVLDKTPPGETEMRTHVDAVGDTTESRTQTRGPAQDGHRRIRMAHLRVVAGTGIVRKWNFSQHRRQQQQHRRQGGLAHAIVSGNTLQDTLSCTVETQPYGVSYAVQGSSGYRVVASASVTDGVHPGRTG